MIFNYFYLNLINNLNIKHGFDVADASNMYTKYESIFRDRSAVLDLTKAINCQKVLVKMYKQEFGNNIIKSGRTRVDKKQVTSYEFNCTTFY
jgi:hypothetical protein